VFSGWQESNLDKQFSWTAGFNWLRRSVAGLSLRSLVFDPRSVHVTFAVDDVALGQGFPPVGIMPTILRTH
jgi:hypothetical protein